MSEQGFITFSTLGEPAPIADADMKHLKPSTMRVFRMLLDAGERGVTSGEFCAAYILALGRRIDEVRKAGFTVTAHRMNGTEQRRYLLQEKP